MNKKLTLAALSALMLTACSNEDFNLDPTLGQPTEVTFTVGLPEGLQTRTENTTVGKGYSVERLYVTAISKADATKRVTKKIDDAFAGNATTANVTLNLVKGDTYNIVFWADCGDDNYYTYDPATANVTVQYKTLLANDEKLDAFTKYVPSFTAGDVAPEPVKLNRPLAQVNIANTMQDATDAKDLGVNVTRTSLKLAYDAYPTLNLITGEMSGTPKTYTVDAPMTFTSTPKPTGELIVNGTAYNYLAYTYVLAGTNGNVLTNVNFNFDSNTAKRDYSNIPVKRNYRTNIIGQIITNPYDFNVILDTPFTGDIDGNVPSAFVHNTTDLHAALSALQDGETLNLMCDPGVYEFTKANSLPNNLNATIVLTGNHTRDAVEPIVFDFSGIKFGETYGAMGCNIIINNAEIRFNETDSNQGIHCLNLQVNNSKIYGQWINYTRETASFNNCEFVGGYTNPDKKMYPAWVWGGTDVSFKNCEFNMQAEARAILIYSDSYTKTNKKRENVTTHVLVDNCRFDGQKADVKGAIQINSEHYDVAEVRINNCTVSDKYGAGLYYEIDNSATSEVPTFYSTFIVNGVTEQSKTIRGIKTADQFKAMLEAPQENLTYSILADIDFDGTEIPPTKGNGPFKITVEGNNHTIKNFKQTNKQAAGLFSVANACTFRNFTIENADITSTNDGNDNAYAGALIGKSYSNTISNVTVKKSKIHGINKVGGLVGFATEEGTYRFYATNCHVTNCTITNEHIEGEAGQLGGMMGYAQVYEVGFFNCSVTNCTIIANMDREDRFCSQFLGTMHGSADQKVVLENCTVSGNTFTLQGSAPVAPVNDLFGGNRKGGGTISY